MQRRAFSGSLINLDLGVDIWMAIIIWGICKYPWFRQGKGDG